MMARLEEGDHQESPLHRVVNAHYAASFLASVRYALIAREVLYAASVEFIAASKLEVAPGLTKNDGLRRLQR